MKLRVSQSPVQSDPEVNNYICLRQVSYATVAASRRPSCASCWLVKRGVLPVVTSADSAQARRCVQSDLCSIVALCDPIRDLTAKVF